MLHRAGIILVLAGLGAVGWTVWQTKHQSAGIYGVVQADAVHIASLEGGRLAEVLVEEGQSVHTGQVLARIDPFTLTEALAAAEAELSAAQAEHARVASGRPAAMIAEANARCDRLAASLAGLRNGAPAEEIEMARLAVKRAEDGQTYARANLDRLTRLQKMARASQPELEEATHAVATARWTAESARHRLALLEAGTPAEDITAAEAALSEATAALELLRAGYSSAELAAAEARVASAEAKVAAIHKRMGELELKSPCECVVESMAAGAGTLIDAGQRWALLRDPSHLAIDIEASVRDLRAIHPGRAVALRLESQPDNDVTGHVVRIAATRSASQRGLLRFGPRLSQVATIHVTIDPDESGITPGMVAELRFRNHNDPPTDAVEPEPHPVVATGHQGAVE